MDNREAKFILNAYRPDGQDANDRRFFEALDQARRDPILERWFQDSILFDAAVTEKLCAITVPADLRENILAGVKISRPLHWSKPFVNWAIAAALTLMAILGSLIWHNTRPAHLAGWQNEAIDVISSLVSNKSSFDAQSRDSGELVAWLRVNDAPAAEKLPQSLQSLQSLGCKTFLWDRGLVSVICFTRPEGGLIHLVVRKASAASDYALKAEPELVQRGDWATATWREGDKVYMLAMEGRPEQLRSYLL